MILHQSETRGLANHGWLTSRHTFSFADYYNPGRMGFGALRVINDDEVDANMGFGRHPHKDMEIISIPLEGALHHQDSEENNGLINKGEVQIMSAGTGIVHSEKNASDINPVKFLQIWVLPKKLGVKPRYEQKSFDLKNNELKLVVSPDGSEGSVTINQDAFFSMGKLESQKSLSYQIKIEGNGIYIFVISGEVDVNGQRLANRDGLGILDTESIEIKGLQNSEIVLMEVPH
ncbi:MAG TPA: pirin family protein [Bacteriovoracaceae bacterium]|nr:pirin family protein [Bacteriovoracaceae bacterium]